MPWSHIPQFYSSASIDRPASSAQLCPTNAVPTQSLGHDLSQCDHHLTHPQTARELPLWRNTIVRRTAWRCELHGTARHLTKGEGWRGAHHEVLCLIKLIGLCTGVADETTLVQRLSRMHDLVTADAEILRALFLHLQRRQRQRCTPCLLLAFYLQKAIQGFRWVQRSAARLQLLTSGMQKGRQQTGRRAFGLMMCTLLISTRH